MATANAVAPANVKTKFMKSKIAKKIGEAKKATKKATIP